MFARLVSPRVSFSQSRSFAKKASSKDGQLNVEFQKAYKLHGLTAEEGPAMSRVTNKEELLGFFREMTLMRRMEIAADVAYKQRKIRGFLHLYNGQEAVASGLESQMSVDDHAITAYRCHAFLISRRTGVPVKEVLAELQGKSTGASKGLAFTEKKVLKSNNVTFAYMGDGAANQGQVYEAFNLAAVHKLPIVYVVENNKYAMGTPIDRASATQEFYTRGHYIPGIQFDGMNVLQAAEVSKFAINYAKNSGPILLEAMTYRYKGHSMSDPGTTYRTRDEVDGVRTTSDPIAKIHFLLIDNGLATEEELKAITDSVKAEVAEAQKFADSSAEPVPADLFTHVYVEDMPIRGTELKNSYKGGYLS